MEKAGNHMHLKTMAMLYASNITRQKILQIRTMGCHELTNLDHKEITI